MTKVLLEIFSAGEFGSKFLHGRKWALSDLLGVLDVVCTGKEVPAMEVVLRATVKAR